MRVLLVHNKYQQSGGEDRVFDYEGELLEQAGVEVRRLVVSNDRLVSTVERLKAAAYVAHNPWGVRAVVAAIEQGRPDLVHVHNVFPLLTPAIFFACRARGRPVVHTLHNFRVVCANATLSRDGHVCEDCISGGPWRAVPHRCYRGSAFGTAAVARSIELHQRRGTWLHDVDRFIALSEFARSLLARAGLPAAKIAVKPNCTPDPLGGGAAPIEQGSRSGFLFVGRLSPEKGVDVLLAAFAGLRAELVVIGDGPDQARLRAAAGPNVVFLGAQDRAEVSRRMARAQALIAPSIWYEGFPLVIAEAFAHGLPVLASRIGALEEVVQPDRTGRLFRPGDAGALAEEVARLIAEPAAAEAMGRGARRAYEELFSPAVTVRRLQEIYADAIAEHAQEKAARPLTATR